ncbi:MAG TPA: 50S ribosomal protein L25 [Anaerolineaceae bacterium]|nr:50S ribosomal protein L25 [Anaerolineaceae bacterium]
MEKAVIKAEPRTVIGKKVGVLRREGKLPGVIYGHKIEPVAITMDLKEASKILAGLTASSLVTINLDGKEHATLVREKQMNYIRGTLTHVDFQVVSLTEKIRAKVAIVIHGTSPAIKDFNGVLMTGVSELNVEALPQNLPERYIIDVTELKNIGDAVYVRDITAGKDVEILDNLDEMVVLVTASTEEEEVAPAEAGAAEPEVIEKGKKEEEGEE